MPSPFPGMDPYLEAPHIWPDVHDALAAEMRNELNQSLPSPYYARLQMRPELGIVEESKGRQRVVPDVVIVHSSQKQPLAATTALLERPRRDISRSIELVVDLEPIRHHFVEIRDPNQGHKLITLIEILSPSNKRPGPDREDYRRKQREILDSDANLVEIDLHRSGERVLADLNLEALLAQTDPRPDYIVSVNRAWLRATGNAYQIFPCSLHEWLPCFPVPLKQGETEVLLDLQYAFNRAYDSGPYRRGAVDYALPPVPPLPPEDAAWAETLVRAAAAPQLENP
ncbi:MAG: DUF4058 family protein [Isosphaeraceae bacterium]|nr:DUF4058 family protein [Isosphaeraceae bacterium]